MFTQIEAQARQALGELAEAAALKKGDLLVIGCSSSEMVGERIGKGSSMEAAQALLRGIWPEVQSRGIFLAAQCCEHLNRCLILERATAERFGYEIVNVRPQPKAGGSFATAVWERMEEPVAVEHIRAHAGMDIGSTLIGMHLKEVAVPLRLSREDTDQLLRTAGLALSRSSKFDLVVEYFIREGIFDVMQINEALYAFDLPLLGN